MLDSKQRQKLNDALLQRFLELVPADLCAQAVFEALEQCGYSETQIEEVANAVIRIAESKP